MEKSNINIHQKVPTIDYDLNINYFLRRVFFIHLYQHAFKVHKYLNPSQIQSQQEQRQLNLSILPEIKETENSYSLSQKFKQEIQILLAQQNKSDATLYDIGMALYRTLKLEFLFCIFLNVFGIIVRVAATITFQYLLNFLQAQQYSQAYIMSGVCSVLYFLDSTMRHNIFYQTPIFTGQLKSTIISCIFKKILYLTQFTSNKGQIGKTINMLSNDFNLIQIKAPFLFGLIVSPLAIIAIVIILFFRLQYEGFIAIGVPLGFIPIQFLVAHLTGAFIAKVNINKDKRVKITTQIIDAIKFIKINGWEMKFKQIINKIRQKQLSDLLTLCAVRSIQSSLARFTIYFGAMTAFYVKAQSVQLSQAMIFSTLQLMSFMRMINFFILMGFGFVVEFKVFLTRFMSLYNIKNIKMICMDKQTQMNSQGINISQIILETKSILSFKNFNGFWKQFEKPVLKDINLQIYEHKFYGLCGPVSSGKSSLFNVILGQMPYYTGKFRCQREISYCQQQIIVFSATIKENIIFGNQFDQFRYNEVVRVSCLLDDLVLFEFGDDTEVGQKGVTLSGGQRARVGLARSLYKKADIYMFDDPLSAVDTKVAKYIFENVFLDFLKSKTVILSTHQVHFLEKCDQVILMQDGVIKAVSNPKKIDQILVKIKDQQQSSKEQHENKQEPPIKKNQRLQENQPASFLLFLRYMFYGNKFLFILVTFLFLISEGALTGFMRVLAIYQDQINGNTDIQSQEGYWAICWSLILGYLLTCLLKYFFLGWNILISNAKIHKKMIHSMCRSHSWYFDITPLGYLANKFSNDIGVMDQTLIFTLQQALQGPFLAGVMIINIIQMNVYFIIICVTCLVILVIIFTYMKPLILKSKQLDLALKTPVFNKLSQSSIGTIQLRLFGNSSKYLQDVNQDITNSFRANLFYWFNTRLLGVTVSFVVTVALIVCFFSGITLFQTPSLYAISIIFMVLILQFLQWFFRNLANAQSMLASVSRCFKMINIQSQRQFVTQYDKSIDTFHLQSSSAQLSITQKSSDQIIFQNFKMKYRPQLPLVLKGVNLKIKKGEKVGIVGRTGAGKSSIIQSVLRICEPQVNSIYHFKGYNALEMGLHTLRHQISVITQTSYLFRDTIRVNMDPFHRVSDKQIWQALQNSNLRKFIQDLPQKLDTVIANNTDVFSVGQKQLFCLARALVRKSEIVILDEATSHVDKKTDRFIQQALRQLFVDKTIIAIAHRLLTVADYDKIIVMEEGCVKQYGSPHQLIERKGVFYQMVKLSQSSSSQIIQLAEKAHFSKQALQK